MPTPSDTIGPSHTLPITSTDVANTAATPQCPPEARSPARQSPGNDHGLLDLPTPPQELPSTNANSMPRAYDGEQSISTTSQETLDPFEAFVRAPRRNPAGIESHLGSTEVPNGVTVHTGNRVTSREHWEGVRQEGARLSQSLDSLRLLEAARQQESEIVPEAATTRARGPSLFQSLSRRRPLISEHPQVTTAAPAENGTARYVRWPTTPDIPSALLEATRAQLHRSERPSSAAEAQNVEEALSRAYRTLQDHSGSQQPRSPANQYGRAVNGRSLVSMNHRSTLSQTQHGRRDPEDQDAVMAQPASSPTSSGDRAGFPAPHTRQYERQADAGIHPTIAWPHGNMSHGADPDRSDMVISGSPTIPGTLKDSSKPRNSVLPGHGFGRYQPSSLHAGSTFVGTQCSDRQEYNVKVEIKHVDMDDSFLCGHLIIEGLTQDHPKLETYFEAEIIGDKYEFATRHPDWGSSEKQDMLHWNRFAAWKPLYRPYRHPELKSESSAKDFAERENIFMRWKEYFLVPDHRVTAISGASFEGFYYICFNQRRASFSGIYYHAKSERWQQLELKHVTSENRGGMPAVEMA